MVTCLCFQAFADAPTTAATTEPIDPTARTTTKPATRRRKAKEAKDDRLVETHHALSVGGKTIRYTATAGTMAQKDESGKSKADMFFVAYTLDGRIARRTADDSADHVRLQRRARRGVASGCTSATAGPKRIDIDENGIPSAPPFRTRRQ